MRLACSYGLSSLLLLGLLTGPQTSCRAADVDLNGTWKLVVLAFGDDEFVLVDIKADGDKATAQVKGSQPFLGMTRVKSVERKGDSVSLVLEIFRGESVFRGSPAKDDPQASKIFGTFTLQDSLFPARLERTTQAQVAPRGKYELMLGVQQSQAIADPKARAEKLKALVDASPATPTLARAYEPLVRAAADAGQPEGEIRGYVDKWLATARPYGELWTNQTWATVLQALSGKDKYAGLSVELARAAEKEMGDAASDEQRAQVASLLAKAARTAGQADVAGPAEERAERLNRKIDEEYQAKVPPFKPEAYEARKDSKNDRVVLMELFTGAQCPPCVAADVAFDALNSTYKAGELVTLQYHLHIPGPDPMTNPDSVARAQYYEVQSTPSTFFNGRAEAQGGGPMAGAKPKYDQYRGLIDAALEGKRRAAIDLDVKRSGDEVHIKASARTLGEGKPGEDRKPKLRLALVEDTVRYVGGNRLRLHHHVVRALPGDAAGKALSDGKAEAEVTVNLADVRKALEADQAQFRKTREFPADPPSLAMKHLSVVAFVQDDADKAVWHAVMAHAEADGSK